MRDDSELEAQVPARKATLYMVTQGRARVGETRWDLQKAVINHFYGRLRFRIGDDGQCVVSNSKRKMHI